MTLKLAPSDHDRLRPQVLDVALVILKRLKQRDADYYEERAKGWLEYCRHGTYIGDPYGPDYMCGACENDVSIYDEALFEAWSRVGEHRLTVEAVQHLTGLGYLTVGESISIGILAEQRLAR